MKTMLDLYLSAHKAAEASLELTGPSVDKTAIEAFESAGGHPDDYDQWKQIFNNVRMNLTGQRNLHTPSVQRQKQEEMNQKMIEQQKAMAAAQKAGA